MLTLTAMVTGIESPKSYADGVTRVTLTFESGESLVVKNEQGYDLDDEIKVTLEVADPFEKYRDVPFMQPTQISTDEPPHFLARGQCLMQRCVLHPDRPAESNAAQGIPCCGECLSRYHQERGLEFRYRKFLHKLIAASADSHHVK